MDRARGCDVSHWHFITDAAAVYNSGVSFVGVKATQGITYVDPKFNVNRTALRSQPFAAGFYYAFASPGDAVTQAHHLLDVVGVLRDNERLCLDLEDDKTGKPAVDLTFATGFYGELLKDTSRRPQLYTSDRIWQQLGNPDWPLAAQVDLILPRYGLIEPVVPKPWRALGKTWSFWQYSEQLAVPGISDGICDASFFNGDLDALKAYVALAPQVT
jgi:GH25 family lysozyme M1 (1,4-beta-N-acetylmuramidase)